MMSFLGWLFGSSGIPVGPLVWMTSGLGIAVILTALLLVAVGVLAWHHDPHSGARLAERLELSPPADSRLPNAA